MVRVLLTYVTLCNDEDYVAVTLYILEVLQGSFLGREIAIINREGVCTSSVKMVVSY